MIRVKFEIEDESIRMRVTGHAGYGRMGKDIVCSAVSVLVQTLGESIFQLGMMGKLAAEPAVQMDGGRAFIECRPNEDSTEQVLNWFAFVQTGMSLLADAYPQCVDIKMFGDREQP